MSTNVAVLQFRTSDVRSFHTDGADEPLPGSSLFCTVPAQ